MAISKVLANHAVQKEVIQPESGNRTFAGAAGVALRSLRKVDSRQDCNTMSAVCGGQTNMKIIGGLPICVNVPVLRTQPSRVRRTLSEVPPSVLQPVPPNVPKPAYSGTHPLGAHRVKFRQHTGWEGCALARDSSRDSFASDVSEDGSDCADRFDSLARSRFVQALMYSNFEAWEERMQWQLVSPDLIQVAMLKRSNGGRLPFPDTIYDRIAVFLGPNPDW